MEGRRWFLAIPMLLVIFGWYWFIAKSEVSFERAELPGFITKVIEKHVYYYSQGVQGNTSGTDIIAAFPFEYEGIPYILTIEMDYAPELRLGGSNYTLRLYYINGTLYKEWVLGTRDELGGWADSYRLYYYTLPPDNKIVIMFAVYDYDPEINANYWNIYKIIVGKVGSQIDLVEFDKVKTIKPCGAWASGPAALVLISGDKEYYAYIHPINWSFYRFIIEDNEGNILYEKNSTNQMKLLAYETKDYVYFGYKEYNAEQIGVWVYDKTTGIIKKLYEGQGAGDLIGDYEHNVVMPSYIRKENAFIAIGDTAYRQDDICCGERIFVKNNTLYILHEGHYPNMNVTMEIYNITIVSPNEVDLQKIGEVVLYNTKDEDIWEGNYSFGGHDVRSLYYKALYSNRLDIALIAAHESNWTSYPDGYESKGRVYRGLIKFIFEDNVYDIDKIKVWRSYYKYNSTTRETEWREGRIISFVSYHPKYVLLATEYNAYGNDTVYTYNKTSEVYVITTKSLQQPPSPPPEEKPKPSPAPPAKPKEEVKPTNVTNVTNITYPQYPGVQAVMPITPKMVILVGFILALFLFLYWYYSRH